ncbi:hypothetical protein DFH11DRAFT_882429 [Phellopilus nigrolimitatus]|nr:hypothetical protein DFH11DRAFT_882429 [Phellopilus nigrolimitatus]
MPPTSKHPVSFAALDDICDVQVCFPAFKGLYIQRRVPSVPVGARHYQEKMWSADDLERRLQHEAEELGTGMKGCSALLWKWTPPTTPELSRAATPVLTFTPPPSCPPSPALSSLELEMPPTPRLSFRELPMLDTSPTTTPTTTLHLPPPFPRSGLDAEFDDYPADDFPARYAEDGFSALYSENGGDPALYSEPGPNSLADEWFAPVLTSSLSLAPYAGTNNFPAWPLNALGLYFPAIDDGLEPGREPGGLMHSPAPSPSPLPSSPTTTGSPVGQN